MTKAQFFNLLNKMAVTHNAKAADFKIYTLVETPEKQAELLRIAPRREWFFNAIGFSVRNCYNFCAHDHKSVDAFNRNLPMYTRWLNEWKAAKSAEEVMDEMHAEALELNGLVDIAIDIAKKSGVNWQVGSYYIRDEIFAKTPDANRRFVAGMMASVNRICNKEI